MVNLFYYLTIASFTILSTNQHTTIFLFIYNNKKEKVSYKSQHDSGLTKLYFYLGRIWQHNTHNALN